MRGHISAVVWPRLRLGGVARNMVVVGGASVLGQAANVAAAPHLGTPLRPTGVWALFGLCRRALSPAGHRVAALRLRDSHSRRSHRGNTPPCVQCAARLRNQRGVGARSSGLGSATVRGPRSGATCAIPLAPSRRALRGERRPGLGLVGHLHSLVSGARTNEGYEWAGAGGSPDGPRCRPCRIAWSPTGRPRGEDLWHGAAVTLICRHSAVDPTLARDDGEIRTRALGLRPRYGSSVPSDRAVAAGSVPAHPSVLRPAAVGGVLPCVIGC